MLLLVCTHTAYSFCRKPRSCGAAACKPAEASFCRMSEVAPLTWITAMLPGLCLQEPVSSSACFAGLLDQGDKAKQQLAQVPPAAPQAATRLTRNHACSRICAEQCYMLRLPAAGFSQLLLQGTCVMTCHAVPSLHSRTHDSHAQPSYFLLLKILCCCCCCCFCMMLCGR